MTSAWRRLLGVSFALRICAAGESGNAFDGEALVQLGLGLESRAEVHNQIATFNMLSEAVGLRFLSKFQSRLNKDDEDDDPGDEQPEASVHEQQSALEEEAALEAAPPSGCTEQDFKMVEQHVRALAANYSPRVQTALKNNDTVAVKDLIQEIMPAQCNAKSIITLMGIRWEKLEACIKSATHVSGPCARCPLHFLQQTAGKNVLEVPFSCAAKCAPMATAGLKCEHGEASECDKAVLETAVPCMRCMNPKLVDLGTCSGLPHAPWIAEKLNALLAALGEGKEQVDNLLKKEAEAGREELQSLAQQGSLLTKVMGLTLSAVLD